MDAEDEAEVNRAVSAAKVMIARGVKVVLPIDKVEEAEVIQERTYWRELIEDLQEVKTIAWIAEQLHEEDRQVWRWKAGTPPRGWSAIGLYLLHMKHCPNRQRQIGHVPEPS